MNTELVATFRENWDLLVNTAQQPDFADFPLTKVMVKSGALSPNLSCLYC